MGPDADIAEKDHLWMGTKLAIGGGYDYCKLP